VFQAAVQTTPGSWSNWWTIRVWSTMTNKDCI
jgi:hypothetical protein